MWGPQAQHLYGNMATLASSSCAWYQCQPFLEGTLSSVLGVPLAALLLGCPLRCASAAACCLPRVYPWPLPSLTVQLVQ